MKRTLSLVLALVMILGTIPAFAAAPTVNEAAEFLNSEEVNVLRGNLSEGALMLEDGLKRQDSVIMLSRLLGEEDVVKATEGEPTWEDIKDEFYNPVLKWAQDAKWYNGHSEVRFGYDEVITAQDYSLVLLRALGYVDELEVAWADAYDKAIELGLLEDIGEKTEITRGEMAVMTFIALGTEMADGEGTLADALEIKMPEEEVEELVMTVEATGVRKLTVKFNQAVDKEEAKFEVKRGSVKPSVKTVTFADDNKSAVIEFNVNMTAGDYTVTVTGLTEEALTATVAVEAEKLVSIEFLSETGIIANTTASAIKTNVLAKNQYGEDVTSKLTASNMSSSKGTVTFASGVMTMSVTSGTFTVGEKVVVTVVYPTTGIVATQTLTVAQAANVKSIEFGEITTDKTTLVGKPINVTAMTTNALDYYLPIVVKDQYGNTLKASDLANGFNVISSNPNIVKLGTPTIVDLANNKGTAVKFTNPAVTPTVSGTVVITAVSASTGVAANTTINVLANSTIDAVTLETPATELKLNKAAVLPIVVIDNYGNEMNLNDIIIAGSESELTLNSTTKITATGAKLTVEKDYVKKETTIKVEPIAKNVILTVTTGTGKYQSLVLAALDAPKVASIKGVKADFATMLADDATLKTKLVGNVEFLDQYGEAITVDYNSGTVKYTIEQKTASSHVTTFNVGTGEIFATENAGTDTYVVKALDGTTELDTLEVKVTVVDKETITAFGVEDLNKFYTAGANSAYDQTVVIYGLVNGNKVVVKQDMIVNITASNTLQQSTTGAAIEVAKLDTNGEDKAFTVTVLVDNGKSTFVVTKDAVYSDAAPKATAIVAKVGTTTIAADTVQVTSGSAIVFSAKDQYGVNRTSISVVTSSVDGAAYNTSTGVVTGASGKSIQLNAFVDGVMRSVKVIVK